MATNFRIKWAKWPTQFHLSPRHSKADWNIAIPISQRSMWLDRVEI